MQLAAHRFLGVTKSLDPATLAVVDAKIIERGGRVYFRKLLPDGSTREDFVCSDVNWYDRAGFNTPGKTPHVRGADPKHGCPLDCGLCTEHEQHTCVGLVEITAGCNLTCPMCYAHSAPGGKHLSFGDCVRAIDRLVEVEGRPEVLQLSGGEPTVHPRFTDVFDYAVSRPIDYVMINTNGLRFAKDDKLLAHVAERRKRCEIYFQFDSLKSGPTELLRGEDLVDVKLKALDRLGEAGLNCILVCCLQPGVNDGEIGDLVKFGLERPHVTGISFQPATYSGRNVEPADLEKRVTFPDVIRGVCEQTGGLFAETDFLPLPCAHPNCHQLTYAYRGPGTDGTPVPLPRFLDVADHVDLLANGITFTRPRARKLIERFLNAGCGPGCGCGPEVVELDSPSQSRGVATPRLGNDAAQQFFARGLAEELNPRDVFRITITNFLDPYNFDVRRLMRCCTHHVLPSGHVIPFCAYNTLYRDGHVPLPELVR